MPFSSVLGPLISYGMIAPNTSGLESLDQKVGLGVTSLTVNFPARDGLMFFIWWKFATADKLTVNYNSAAGGNTEHWARVFTAGDFANIAVTFSNYQVASQESIHFTPGTSAFATLAVLSVANKTGSAKPAFFQVQQSTGSVATIGNLNVGAGEWVSATNPQIISAKFAGVALNTMDIRVGVFGRNFP